MLIYLVVFLISLFFINFYYKKNINRSAKIIAIVIGILLPCLLAGFRDYSVGTDINTYGNIWFMYAKNAKNLFKFLQFAKWSNIGIGYALLNYTTARICPSPHFFYFVLNLIANVLIFISLLRNKDICNITLGMAIFYLVFWGIFLNALRQSIAISIVFFSYYYVRHNNIFKFLICIVLAYTFHSSAIIGLLIYFIHFINIYLKNKVLKIVIAFFMLIPITFFWNILSVINSIGLLPNRYAEYLESVNRGGGAVIRIVFYGLLLFLFLIFISRKNTMKEKKDLLFYLIVSLCFSTLAFKDAQSVRVAHYFDVFCCYSIPYLSMNSRVNKSDIIYCKITWAIIFIVYFIFVFGIRGSDGIVPYLFMRS